MSKMSNSIRVRGLAMDASHFVFEGRNPRSCLYTLIKITVTSFSSQDGVEIATGQ